MERLKQAIEIAKKFIEQDTHNIDKGSKFKWNNKVWTVKSLPSDRRGKSTAVIVTAPGVSKTQRIDWLTLQQWLDTGQATLVK
jgi:hypothetical protein